MRGEQRGEARARDVVGPGHDRRHRRRAAVDGDQLKIDAVALEQPGLDRPVNVGDILGERPGAADRLERLCSRGERVRESHKRGRSDGQERVATTHGQTAFLPLAGRTGAVLRFPISHDTRREMDTSASMSA